MRASWACLASMIACGCIPRIQEGYFACADDRGCPDGWHCHGDHMCYSWEPNRENSPDDCANGIDDDANGTADCLDGACLAGGFCEDREADCNPVLQTGCPVGMACYAGVSAGETLQPWCRMPGGGLQGDACTGSGSANQCGAGIGCLYLDEIGICSKYCSVDEQCAAGGYCMIGPEDPWGVCTTPCDPFYGTAGACPAGFSCIAKSQLGEYAYIWGGAYQLCYWTSIVRPATAAAGSPCLDPAPAWTTADQICQPGTVCVPDGSGSAFCRAVCYLDAPSPCAGPTESCLAPEGPIYVDRPVMTREDGFALGLCIPA